MVVASIAVAKAWKAPLVDPSSKPDRRTQIGPVISSNILLASSSDAMLEAMVRWAGTLAMNPFHGWPSGGDNQTQYLKSSMLSAWIKHAVFSPRMIGAMKYLGGKHGIGKKVSDLLVEWCPPEECAGYLEPFCGSLGVFKHMTGKGYACCLASDSHPDLIAMWQAVQEGSLCLPKHISKKSYEAIRHTPSPDPLKAVAGFGLSYGGKFFRGYAPGALGASDRDFLGEFTRSIAKIAPAVRKPQVHLACSDYRDISPRDMLVYCDPPYACTEGYSMGGFDHDQFWDVMREWSKDNTVLISEQIAPPDFTCIWRQRRRRSMHHGRSTWKDECVFVHDPGARRQRRTRRK